MVGDDWGIGGAGLGLGVDAGDHALDGSRGLLLACCLCVAGAAGGGARGAGGAGGGAGPRAVGGWAGRVLPSVSSIGGGGVRGGWEFLGGGRGGAVSPGEVVGARGEVVGFLSGS